ncbi:MAG: N-acetyl sugar amidotransferase [Thermoanaerobaculia bacterium]
MTRDYQICTRCIMDTSDADIVFDERGVCHHCEAYDRRASAELFDKDVRDAKLAALVAEIKLAGKGHDYDCLIGVSGGVDSTMVAVKVKELGLRPLALHVDNGWNSELAVKNIEVTLKKLGIDLYTIVLDWEEFRDLQLAFLRSGVANIEIPTDHALSSLLFRTAAEKGIKYIITGANVVSEATMPTSWMHDSRDMKLIKAIHRKFAARPLKTYPACSLARYAWYIVLRGIKYVPILNYMEFHKNDAKAFIQRELGWRDYGGKHFESVFTRFFQGYILPEKFNMDKRRPHLSSLICSGQMSRDEALEEMKNPPYPPDLFREDYDLFVKKMRLTPDEFDDIMKTPPRRYSDYAQAFYFRNKSWIIPLVKSVVKPKSLRRPSPVTPGA